MTQTLQTSHDARESIRPFKATIKERVLAYIRHRTRSGDGATDEEITLALNLNPSTVRPRRIELFEDLSLYCTSATRATKSGRQAVVWYATHV